MTDPYIRFWVLAGFTYGLGHVVRARWLAEEMLRRYGIKSTFRVNDFAAARSYLHASGLEIQEDAYSDFPMNKPVLEIIDALDAPEELLRNARASGSPLLCFENRTATSRLADVVVNPIVAGLRDCSWDDHGVPHHGGPGYLFLSPDITNRRPHEPRTTATVQDILISCGGTDPSNQTSRAIRLLEQASFHGRVSVVVGAGYQGLHPSDHATTMDINFLESPATLGELLIQSDLAILSGGMTLYEASSLGLPALVVAQNDHQTLTGQRFQEIGCAQLLPDDDPEGNIHQVKDLLNDDQARACMSAAGLSLLDGQAPRLFPILESLIFSRS